MDIAKLLEIAIPSILSIVAMYVSYKARSKTNEIASQNRDLVAQNTALAAENTRLSNANTEIQLRKMISESKNLICSALQYRGSVEEKPEKKIEIAEKLKRIAKQEMLNAYEEACMKYLDAKIDKERFKKTYIIEIRQLVESDSNKDKFGTSSPYTAIKKVYNEWNNLEK